MTELAPNRWITKRWKNALRNDRANLNNVASSLTNASYVFLENRSRIVHERGTRTRKPERESPAVNRDFRLGAVFF